MYKFFFYSAEPAELYAVCFFFSLFCIVCTRAVANLSLCWKIELWELYNSTIIVLNIVLRYNIAIKVLP